MASRPMIGLASPGARRSFVRVLEVDPELGGGLNEEEARKASRHLMARTTTVPAGRWEPGFDCPPPEACSIGALVVEGILAKRVEVPGGSSLELLGAGDIMRPQEHDEGPASWTILGTTTLAWLDHEFALVASHWPAVNCQLVRRTMQRASHLSCHLAISHIVGVEMRILRLLGHLAERWGRVTREGVLVPIPLTNEMVGTIIGARPPSVSTALRKLMRADLVVRRTDATWILHQSAVTDEDTDAPIAALAATG